MKFSIVTVAMSLFLSSVVSFASPTIYTQDKPAVIVSANQPEFVLKLKANPTTGFTWFLSDYNDKLIVPLKHVYQPPISQLVGASGYDLWTFRVLPAGFTVPQQTVIRLVYQRAWEALGQSQVQTFKVVTGP